MELTFQAHVESVSQLVRLGAENAADSTAFIYDLAQEDLADAALLLRDRPRPVDRTDAMKALNLAVWVSLTGDRTDGIWGAVPFEERSSVVEEVLGREPATLVDSGPVRINRLYCLWMPGEKATDIYCKDASSLSGYQQKAGLGPLIKQVSNLSVLYAAIQDEKNILAASSPSLELPPVGDDPFLSRILAAGSPGLHYRRYAWNGKQLFEGTGIFQLADGTAALLRVGVDASSLIDMENRTGLRQKVMGTTALILLILSIIAAQAFSRWQSRGEEEQRVAAGKEEQNRHWQAIGQMAATVAHEVRTPLSTLKMIGQRLKKEFTVDDRDRAEFEVLLALLDSESERVNRVISEFLELGKPLVPARRRTELAVLIGGCLTSLSLRASLEGKALNVVEPVPAGEVSVDPERFFQIIQNLAGNALDAVRKGGKVEISAAHSGNGFTVRISDDGPGMDPGALLRAQQPFVTTKSHGTGLGLPLARRLVEAHGGRMEIRSRVGEGTVIDMFFPDAGTEEQKETR